MANRSPHISQLLEPTWDRAPDAGRGAEPIWSEPTTVQAAPAQRPQYESHYQDQYAHPGEPRQDSTAPRKAARSLDDDEGEDRAAPRTGRASDEWRPVKLFAGVIGLAIAAGLLWGMADVARKHVARNAGSAAASTATADGAVVPAAIGSAGVR